MLDLDRTRPQSSAHATVRDRHIVDEGMALVLDGQDAYNNPRVKPSTGEANEVFYGVSMFARRHPEFFFATQSLPDLPASDADDSTYATLEYRPAYPDTNIPRTGRTTASVFATYQSNFNVFRGTVRATAGFTITDTTGVIALDFGELAPSATFAASATGIFAQYLRNVPLLEREKLAGTSLSLTTINQGANAGTARRGRFYTSYVDPSDVYAIGDRLEVAAGGRFKKSSTSTDNVQIDAYVIHLPTNDDPFLGFEMI